MASWNERERSVRISFGSDSKPYKAEALAHLSSAVQLDGSQFGVVQLLDRSKVNIRTGESLRARTLQPG
jgi:hypothetical protein